MREDVNQSRLAALYPQETISAAVVDAELSQPAAAVANEEPLSEEGLSASVERYLAAYFASFGDGGVFFVDPNLRTPYTFQYNLSIQQELPARIVLQTAYVGSTSHKLTALADINPFDPKTLNTPTPHRILNETPGNTDASFSFLEEFRNAADANYNS